MQLIIYKTCHIIPKSIEYYQKSIIYHIQIYVFDNLMLNELKS